MGPQREYFHKTWDLWASIVTVAVGIASLTGFSVNLADRVAQLEKQIDHNSPSVNNSSVSKSTGSTAAGQDGLPVQPVPNSVAAACADLAKRSADEISRGSWLSSEQIQKTMAGLQCGSLKN